MEIRQIMEPSEKSEICSFILQALPRWFSNADANAAFIKNVREMPFLAAMENDEAIGFIALELTEQAADIHVMGVLPDYHRRGIGRQLIARCEQYCLSQNIPVMTVKTLAGTHPSKSYAKTRLFYEGMGFAPEKITEEWGSEQQCLHMRRRLAPELWDIYNSGRNKTGRLHERDAPLAVGDYHLVVHVWIRNSRGEWLMDKRAPEKTLAPNIWETTGGSALAGETSLEAALRETREELGITLRPANGYLWRSLRRGDDFCDVWIFEQDVSLADIIFQPGETCDARWAAAGTIRAMMREGTYFPTPYFEELAAGVTIRREQPADYDEVYALVKAAFATLPHGDGTEADYLHALRTKDTFIPALSFVAIAYGSEKIVGQIVLYQTIVTTRDGPRAQLLLSPISVHPAQFRRGIARAMTEHALAKAKAMGYGAVFLCGDPAIYKKLGFAPTHVYGIYHVKDAAAEWSMARELYEGALDGLKGLVDII